MRIDFNAEPDQVFFTSMRIQIQGFKPMRMRIRIPFFSSVANKPTKNKSFYANYYLYEGTFTSVFIDTGTVKSQKEDKIVEIKVFLLYLLVFGRVRIRTK